ncbi:integrase family protein [Oceanithermus profundus DSM 14977]|uniref:Integrase family protein n=1 Tax=Oceanithermus profundus (strain DSM 14977 / NBRC 100410 / VKM B-2274 / 506) TaxID=670487 RepID=E4U9E0_OCEP5|nr:site-specific integrase [Oceanithermus profundus]ADR36969.1 integrase family protein [Oceanithermus profundus DSM 14977]
MHEDSRLADIINQALGDRLLEDLTPMQVQDWLDGLDYSHRTKLRALQMLRNALAEAEALELLHRNAAAPVKLPRQPRQTSGQAWTLDEARRFLAAAQKRRLCSLYRIMLALGLRVGGAIAFEVGDWAHDPAVGSLRLRTECTATVEGSLAGVKTPAARRTVYAPDDLAVALSTWLERREAEAGLPSWDEQGWLIPASNGRLLSHNNVRRDLRAAIAEAGVPRIRLHDLRHTAANLMRQAGIGREVRMQILGHQIRDVHDIYTHHVEPGELVRAARALHGLFPVPGETPTGVTGVSQQKEDGA